MTDDGGFLVWFLSSPWFAVLVGTVGQVFGAQRVKFWFPLHWTEFKRSRIIEAVSFPLAWIPTFMCYWGGNGWTAEAAHTALWLGFVVWLAGTILYKIFAAILHRWNPELASSLSAHDNAIQKLVECADGRLEERPISQPSGPGEHTKYHVTTKPKG